MPNGDAYPDIYPDVYQDALGFRDVASIAGDYLALWYRSDTYEGGTAPDVAAAANKTPGAAGLGDLAQASVPTRPHFQNSAGYAEWDYTPTQYLQSASGSAITAANEYLDLIVVGRFDDAGNRILFDFISTSPLQDGLILRIDGGALKAQVNLSQVVTSAWTPDTALHRFRVRCTSTEVSLWVDEGTPGTGAGDAKQANPRNTATCGAGYNGFQGCNGKSSEVVLLRNAPASVAEDISAFFYSQYKNYLP